MRIYNIFLLITHSLDAYLIFYVSLAVSRKSSSDDSTVVVHKLQNLKSVLHCIDVSLHFLDGLTLLNNEFFFFHYLRVQCIKQKVQSSSFLLCDDGDPLFVVIKVLRRNNFDARLLALIQNVGKTALAVLNGFYACCIWQRKCLFILIQVYKMALRHVAHALDNSIGVIFWNGNSVQFHKFGSDIN